MYYSNSCLNEAISGFNKKHLTTQTAFMGTFLPQIGTDRASQSLPWITRGRQSGWSSESYGCVALQRHAVISNGPIRSRNGPKRRPRRASEGSPGKNRSGSAVPKPPLRMNLGDSERLQKVLSRLGVASRRNAEELIAEGKVRVNSKVVREQGVLVNVRHDRIDVNGKTVEAPSKAIWVAVHKPRGFLSLGKEGHWRSAANLLPRSKRRSMVPAGSIEEDFSGLLLMTNDRGQVPELSRPDNPHMKEWVVDVDGIVKDSQIDPLRRGVKLKDQKTNALPVVSSFSIKAKEY